MENNGGYVGRTVWQQGWEVAELKLVTSSAGFELQTQDKSGRG